MEDKQRLVLSVLAGEMTRRGGARRAGTSETSVGKWKQQFLEVGRAGLEASASSREAALKAEVEDIKAALGEAHLVIRAWRRTAEGRPGPTPALR